MFHVKHKVQSLMGLATQTKEIDGFSVQVTQLSCRRALKTLNRLGKVLGPALAKVSAIVSNAGSIEKVDVGSMGSSVESLFSSLADDDLDFFVNTFFEASTLNNAPFLKTFDVVLQGQVDVLLRALLFAIEVNYGNFFNVARKLVPLESSAKKTS